MAATWVGFVKTLLAPIAVLACWTSQEMDMQDHAKVRLS